MSRYLSLPQTDLRSEYDELNHTSLRKGGLFKLAGQVFLSSLLVAAGFVLGWKLSAEQANYYTKAQVIWSELHQWRYISYHH